jgi:polysaccharide export outer membrane protein
VTFFGQNELYREVRVNGQGEISMPLVGNVRVAGLSPRQVEQKLATIYKEGRYLKQPQITVFVKEYRHQRVAVTGAVNRPDYYEVIGPRSLLEVLGMAGGLKENAADVVHVIRRQGAGGAAGAGKSTVAQPLAPGTQTIVVDLNRLVRQGAIELNVSIGSGDVVHVPFAQNAYVLGAVNKPGNVPVRDNMTAAQAVAMAGGLKPELASNRASIVRFDDAGQRVVIPINLWRVTRGQEEDTPLRPNDIVYVYESPLRRVLFDLKTLNPGMFSMGVAP